MVREEEPSGRRIGIGLHACMEWDEGRVLFDKGGGDDVSLSTPVDKDVCRSTVDSANASEEGASSVVGVDSLEVEAALVQVLELKDRQ